ncbi:MAG TPA: hypothetical protein VH440_05580 [Candidatus Limnocylindrales bacterium]
MAETRRLGALSDDDLALALRQLGGAIVVSPVSLGADGLDPARRARLRIEAAGKLPRRRLRDRLGLGRRAPAGRPLRRGLLLAVALVLALAAVAGAIGFGLPGLRIVFGPGSTPSPSLSPAPSIPTGSPSASPAIAPSPTPTPTTSGPPGSNLGFGEPVTLDDARARAGFPILLPADDRLGPPDAVWIDEHGRVSLVWLARPGIPASEESGLGVVVSEFPGHIEEGYFQKLLDAGSTIQPVTVRGERGYWIAGRPHEFVYVNPSNDPTFDDRRLVGDTLAWSDGDVTYRVESALGLDEAVRIADGLRE